MQWDAVTATTLLLVKWACDHASPLWTVASLRVDLLHPLQVVLWELVGVRWVWKTASEGWSEIILDWTRSSFPPLGDLGLTRQEEGVVLVSGWVLLGLEEGVKVPERAFYEVVGRHLGETTRNRWLTGCFIMRMCAFLPVSQLLTPSPRRSAGTAFAPSSAGVGDRSLGKHPWPQSCRA